MKNISLSYLKKGFTLIELLVVIAIIALLLSVITPALRKAKDHAKKIHCSANLKSLTMAALMYAENNDAYTPSSTNTWTDRGSYKPGWCGRTTDMTTGLALPLDEQINGNSDPWTGLVRGQLWPYIETDDIWRCPADQDKEQMRSYCMGSLWWGAFTTEDNAVSYDTQSVGMVCRKINKIKSPGSRFMFVDQLGENDDAYWAIWYSQPKWWNIPNFMHSGGSVNGFADGHVDSYKLQAKTITLARQAWEEARAGITDFYMVQDDMPGDEDLTYYQLASWGKIGY